MRRPLLLLVCGMVLVARSVSAAQIFEDVGVFPSPTLENDPSIRSVGMGGATGAVFWSGDPNYWLNPGLLGSVEGVRYQDALMDFGTFSISGPGSYEEFHIRETARFTTIGYGGLGIALAGQPFDGAGGMEYGFDGSFGLSEQARSWSAGISLARVAETVHRASTIARHFDLAFGYSQKTLEYDPALFGNGVFWDWGLLARAGTDFAVRNTPARIDVAYGYSYLNHPRDQGGGDSRHELNSAGVHLAAARVPKGFAGLPSWLRTGFEPLISIGGGFTSDYSFWQSQHREAWGGELGLANVLFLRQGWRSAGSRSTWGFGVGLPVGNFGGVRYDQAAYFEDIDFKYRAWSVWLDPLAIARAGR